MNNRTLLTGIGLGAALAFILDPERGARRRALVRDKAVRSARLTGDALDATMRDMSNRTRGIAAAARSKWSGGPVDVRRSSSASGPRSDGSVRIHARSMWTYATAR